MSDLLKSVGCFIDGYGFVNGEVSIFLITIEYLIRKDFSLLNLFQMKVFSTFKCM